MARQPNFQNLIKVEIDPFLRDFIRTSVSDSPCNYSLPSAFNTSTVGGSRQSANASDLCDDRDSYISSIPRKWGDITIEDLYRFESASFASPFTAIDLLTPTLSPADWIDGVWAGRFSVVAPWFEGTITVAGLVEQSAFLWRHGFGLEDLSRLWTDKEESLHTIFRRRRCNTQHGEGTSKKLRVSNRRLKRRRTVHRLLRHRSHSSRLVPASDEDASLAKALNPGCRSWVNCGDVTAH